MTKATDQEKTPPAKSKRPQLARPRQLRATFSVVVSRPGRQDFAQIWQWRYAKQTDAYHKSRVNKTQYQALASARGKIDLLLVDFLFHYSRGVNPFAERPRDKYTVIKREVFFSLVAADFDTLPSGFSSYTELRSYLKEHFPGALVLTTPSRKAKILFLLEQDIPADSSEYGPRWHALKALLSEERLMVFDKKVVALHKVYFNQAMLDFWRDNAHTLSLKGRVSEWAERGGYKISKPVGPGPAVLEGNDSLLPPDSVDKEGRGDDGNGRDDGNGGDGQDEGDGRDGGNAVPSATRKAIITKAIEKDLRQTSQSGFHRRDGKEKSKVETVSKDLENAPYSFPLLKGLSLTHLPPVLDKGSLDDSDELLEVGSSVNAGGVNPLRSYRGDIPSALTALFNSPNGSCQAQRASEHKPPQEETSFTQLLRLLIASPMLRSSSVLPQKKLAKELGVSQPRVNKHVARLVKAGVLEVVDSSYIKGKKAKAYRAKGELLSAITLYYLECRVRRFRDKLPTPETLLVEDGAWNSKLFELTNGFSSREDYLAYVAKIPGAHGKKSRLKQARAAWKSHLARNPNLNQKP